MTLSRADIQALIDLGEEAIGPVLMRRLEDEIGGGQVDVALNADGDTLRSLADEIAAAPTESIFGMPIVRFSISAANRDHIVKALSTSPAAPVAGDGRTPTKEMIQAGVAAFLKDMRDRRLLKWLFSEQDNGAIGYIDRHIDLDAQIECATESVTKSFAAMLAASPSDASTIALMRRALDKVEWSGLPGYCPWCDAHVTDGHEAGCELAQALGRTTP